MPLHFSEMPVALSAGDAATRIAPSAETIDLPSSVVSDAAHELFEFDREELARRLVAAFRRHPHINNVMTHICGSQWARIEQALRTILSPAATRTDLPPLAQNIVELMWAERGVTGRILKPYLRDFLTRNLPPRAAEHLLRHIAVLACAPEALFPGAAAHSDSLILIKAGGR